MDTFISAKDTQGHLIQKYQFKVMSGKEHGGESGSSSSSQNESTPQATQNSQMDEIATAQERVAHNVVDNSQIETLLKKTDELSNSLISMQKSYESQQQEFQKMVEAAKEEAYKQGVLETEKRLKDEATQKSDEEVAKLTQSIDRLDAVTKKFQEKIDTIENDLISTAIDIAKEVINKEISKDSKNIALNLAYLLLDDIKDASKITLKVSPKDYTHIKQRLQAENVQVVADNSISDGGVMILSEAGNIDGDIMQRFEKVKEIVFR
jgi:flagellar assembly protein FliH